MEYLVIITIQWLYVSNLVIWNVIYACYQYWILYTEETELNWIQTSQVWCFELKFDIIKTLGYFSEEEYHGAINYQGSISSNDINLGTCRPDGLYIISYKLYHNNV